jgi:hypothetical protein
VIEIVNSTENPNFSGMELATAKEKVVNPLSKVLHAEKE